MGRGRKGVIDQGNKKIKKDCGPLPKPDRNGFRYGFKKIPVNQTIFDIPEELLNAFRQIDPRDVANILVNP